MILNRFVLIGLLLFVVKPTLSFANTVERVGKTVMPSVVSIAVLSSINDEDALKSRMNMMILYPRKDLFGHEILNPPRRMGSLGSGFVIHSKGRPYIVTNYHTVENAIKIKVTLSDDTVLDATLKGFDSGTDLAVLELIKNRDLPGLKWADSRKVKLGQRAIALGNAYGLGPTLTAGVVSSTGRDLSDPNLGLTSSRLINKFIQTDAAINRGNSGGPLVNEEGHVIGVNFAILTSSGGSDGIGLAIPADMAQKVVQNIIDYGQVKRAWLGLIVQGLTPEISENLKLRKIEGALVATVTDNGPAKQAGIRSRDVILKINETPIRDSTDISRIVGQMAIGEVINISVWRDGTLQVLKATLQELQSHEDYRSTIKTTKIIPKDHIELKGYEMGATGLTWQFRQRFHAENPAINGVLISDVKEGGWAEKNGMMVGDIILEINGIAVSTTDELTHVIQKEASTSKPVLFYIYRMGQKLYVGLRKKIETI